MLMLWRWLVANGSSVWFCWIGKRYFVYYFWTVWTIGRWNFIFISQVKGNGNGNGNGNQRKTSEQRTRSWQPYQLLNMDTHAHTNCRIYGVHISCLVRSLSIQMLFKRPNPHSNINILVRFEIKNSEFRKKLLRSYLCLKVPNHTNTVRLNGSNHGFR